MWLGLAGQACVARTLIMSVMALATASISLFAHAPADGASLARVPSRGRASAAAARPSGHCMGQWPLAEPRPTRSTV